MTDDDTDIETLETELEQKRERLDQLREKRDLEARLDALMDLADNLDGLEDEITEVKTATNQQLKLATGDAYECDECGTVHSHSDDYHKSYTNPEPWEDEGICRSCYRNRQDEQRLAAVAGQLDGATIDLDSPTDLAGHLDHYGSRDYHGIAVFHSLPLTLTDGTEVTLKGKDRGYGVTLAESDH